MTKKSINIKDFHLLYDNVLVKGITISEKDGIYRPEESGSKPELGEVMSVGDGRVFDSGTVVPLKVKVGDTCYFNKYSHTKFNFDGNDYYVIREEDIVGYLRK